jgi:hypothetical protein
MNIAAASRKLSIDWSVAALAAERALRNTPKSKRTDLVPVRSNRLTRLSGRLIPICEQPQQVIAL